MPSQGEVIHTPAPATPASVLASQGTVVQLKEAIASSDVNSIPKKSFKKYWGEGNWGLNVFKNNQEIRCRRSSSLLISGCGCESGEQGYVLCAG